MEPRTVATFGIGTWQSDALTIRLDPFIHMLDLNLIHVEDKGNLPRSARQATAQKENLLSTSPHWSPKKLPSGCCRDETYRTTPSTSMSDRQSKMAAI
jgi:hypothetical protein